ncbi:ankyrin repeat family A protein 2 [Trichonephila clavipes]|nr:ankyrin repeat family A protein 2 [Trichonephila clavipes]
MQHSTVLTNLQRGNVQTENTSELRERSTHELAGQGELFWGDMRFDENFDYSFDPNQTDKHGFTPLMWAASYGQRATIKKLIELGAHINTVGNNGETALILAASAGHAFVVKQLLKHYAIVDHRDELNSCRGVISDSDLLITSEAEILDRFSDQVRRITFKKDASVIPTNHLILTFSHFGIKDAIACLPPGPEASVTSVTHRPEGFV